MQLRPVVDTSCTIGGEGQGITEARELNRRREGCEWEECVCSREATAAPSDVNTQRKILTRRFSVSSCKTADFTSSSVVGFYCHSKI